MKTRIHKSKPSRVDEFGRDHQVYRPHRAGMPNIKRYFRDLWDRREFAVELTHTNMRAENTNTVLGEIWLVLNPLLLAFVYFLLIFIISGNRNSDFAQITSGLFFYFFISGSISSSTNSVTGGGRLIMNQSFPKMLLPLSSVYLALRRFLPTLIVYSAIHLIFRRPITLELLWLPVIILIGTFFGFGVGLMLATSQVYFRDTSSFLPYFIRIWLYVSPVLWSADMLYDRLAHKLGDWIYLVYLNPLFSILGLFNNALLGIPMNWSVLGIAVGMTIISVLFGAWIFMSREREFAVRL